MIDPPGIRSPNGSAEELEQFHTQKRRLSPEQLAHLVSLHDAEIAQADARIEPVLGRLEELGLSSNTLVVFASDDGEELKALGYLQ